eukprot:8119477-Alexandrium_andersonii.AAC.1
MLPIARTRSAPTGGRDQSATCGCAKHPGIKAEGGCRCQRCRPNYRCRSLTRRAEQARSWPFVPREG